MPSGLALHMSQSMPKSRLSRQRESADPFRLPNDPQGSAVLTMACRPCGPSDDRTPLCSKEMREN